MAIDGTPAGGPAAETARFAALAEWFESDLGRAVLACEAALLAGRLPALFGFHLMQLGVSDRIPVFPGSVVRHQFVLGRSPGNRTASALAEAEQLPIDADAIDVAVLHHALDFSPNPHQLLRETARVVVPHGHLLVTGFNPWSLFGARALASRRFAGPIWSARMLSARRIADWLALLDFAVEDIQYRFHAPPVDHAGLLARCEGLNARAARWSLPGGATYLIHARKQMSPLTPVRMLPRRARPRLVGVRLAAPSTRETLH